VIDEINEMNIDELSTDLKALFLIFKTDKTQAD